MNMIEKMARAIEPMQFKQHAGMIEYCLSRGDDIDFAKSTADASFPLLAAFDKAKAALSALKEPTEGMVDGASEWCSSPRYEIPIVFNAMIQSAIEGK